MKNLMDAKIDAYIALNQTHWRGIQAMTREHLERTLVALYVQRQEAHERHISPMSIKAIKHLKYYESETEPPKEGPKIWFRPSDGAHFARSDIGWVQYNPVHIQCSLKVGESVRVVIPPLPRPNDKLADGGTKTL